ncbi:MAG: ribonuclease H-like domain-containing protein [Bacteroidota bacterium]
MNRVVFDIETLGFPLEDFDEKQQEYLLKFAKTDEERIEAIQRMNLLPFTARIIAIGMLNPDSQQGKVFYLAPTVEPFFSEDGMVEFISGTESDILEQFWKTITHYSQFITFNGRSFDCPFLMLRSAMLGIKPSRNLIPYRYSANESCDLMEQLTFYGAFRKFNLDFYCKSFGIKSPKAEGITGLDLGPLYYEGRYREIAEYCLGDIKATTELFHRWQNLLAFER